MNIKVDTLQAKILTTPNYIVQLQHYMCIQYIKLILKLFGKTFIYGNNNNNRNNQCPVKYNVIVDHLMPHFEVNTMSLKYKMSSHKGYT